MYFYESKFHGTVPVCGAMVACTTDVYEPKPDPDPDPVPKPEVPADGSFSIGKSKH